MITAADPSDHGTDLSDHFDRNAQPERDLAFSGHFPQVSPERSEACAGALVAMLPQPVTDRLGRLLLVTLEAARVDADLPVLEALRSWLDSWRGIGDVERGMARHGYDLQLTRYDEKGWRATFYATGMEHSPTSATGSAWELTPWRAVQGAARDALRRTVDG